MPLALWCAISYLPFLWHPMVRVTDPGDVGWIDAGRAGRRASLRRRERRGGAATGGCPPAASRANPVFLPAPHEVAHALVAGFTTPPARPEEPWLHQSLWHSIQVIFWGFLVSSMVGVPLGDPLRRRSRRWRELTEPFIEFFRYLPGAGLRRAGGGGDGDRGRPQGGHHLHRHVLPAGADHRQHHPPAGSGAAGGGADAGGLAAELLITKVVVPGIVVDVYTDMRVLLGWAWTYLIVAELIGVSSGITYFINQQARYRAYDKVFASSCSSASSASGRTSCWPRWGGSSSPG